MADEPQQHLFAQGVGGIFLLFASLFLAGWSFCWLLTAIVVTLAAINLPALCRLFFVLPARPPRHQAIAAVLVIATLSLNTAKPAHPQRVGHAYVPVCDCQNA